MTNGLLFEIGNVNYSLDSLLLKCCLFVVAMSVNILVSCCQLLINF